MDFCPRTSDPFMDIDTFSRPTSGYDSDYRGENIEITFKCNLLKKWSLLKAQHLNFFQFLVGRQIKSGRSTWLREKRSEAIRIKHRIRWILTTFQSGHKQAQNVHQIWIRQWVWTMTGPTRVPPFSTWTTSKSRQHIRPWIRGLIMQGTYFYWWFTDSYLFLALKTHPTLEWTTKSITLTKTVSIMTLSLRSGKVQAHTRTSSTAVDRTMSSCDLQQQVQINQPILQSGNMQKKRRKSQRVFFHCSEKTLKVRRQIRMLRRAARRRSLLLWL